METKEKLVIIGAGMASAYLLEALRERASNRAPEYDITVIGKEDRACYNRVLLSGLLAGEVKDKDLDMLESAPNVRFATGISATGIDTSRRHVLCSNGEQLSYDALVVATGANVAQPSIDVRQAQNIHQVRNIDDVQRLREVAKQRPNQRALVIGGGLLGLEAAHGLNALGMQTRVLHRNADLMNRQLDAEGAAYLKRILESKNLSILTGVTPTSLSYDREGQLNAVTLSDGRTLDCELCVIATGITPCIDLARAVVDCDKGILVDNQLRTSCKDIYALGECCQLGEVTFGLVAPIREQALQLAQVLSDRQIPAAQGDSRVGPSQPSISAPQRAFTDQDWPVQLKISGIDIFRTGDLDDRAEQLVLHDRQGGVYRRLVVRDNRLIGALLVGDKRGGNWYAELISDAKPITQLRRGLLFGREVAEALRSDVVSLEQGEAA